MFMPMEVAMVPAVIVAAANTKALDTAVALTLVVVALALALATVLALAMDAALLTVVAVVRV